MFILILFLIITATNSQKEACEGNIIALSYIASDPEVHCISGNGTCRALPYKGSTSLGYPYYHQAEQMRAASSVSRFFWNPGKLPGKVPKFPWPPGVPKPPTDFPDAPEFDPCTYLPRASCNILPAICSTNPSSSLCQCPKWCTLCGQGCSVSVGTAGAGDRHGGGTASGMSRYPCQESFNCLGPPYLPERTACYSKCTGRQYSMDCEGSGIDGDELRNGCTCSDPMCWNDCNKCRGSYCNYCSCQDPGEGGKVCRAYCARCAAETDCSRCNCNNSSFCNMQCSKCNVDQCGDCDCQNDISCQGCPKCIEHCYLCAYARDSYPDECAPGQCSHCPHCGDCDKPDLDCLALPDALCPGCFLNPGNNTNSTNPPHPPIPSHLGQCSKTSSTTQCGFCSCDDQLCIDACGTCCAEKVKTGRASCQNTPFNLPDPVRECSFSGNITTLVAVELQSGQQACFKSEERVRGVHGHLVVEEGPELRVAVLRSWIEYPLLDGYYMAVEPDVALHCFCHCIGSLEGSCVPDTNLCHGHHNCMNVFVGDSGGKGCAGNSNTCCSLKFSSEKFGEVYHLSGPRDVISEVLVTFGNWSEIFNVSLDGEVHRSAPNREIHVRAAGYLEQLPYEGNTKVLRYQNQLYWAPDFNGHNDFDPLKGGWIKVHSDSSGNMLNNSFDYSETAIAGNMVITTKRCFRFKSPESLFHDKMDFDKSSFRNLALMDDVVQGGKMEFEVGELRGLMRLRFDSGNPLIISVNATAYGLTYYERTIHVKTFNCIGTGDVRSGVMLNCTAQVDASGGTVQFWQIDKYGNIVKTETVYAGTNFFGFELEPDLEPSSNQSLICTNGVTRDLCLNFTYHVNTDPVIIPDWSVPVKQAGIPELEGDDKDWDWWNPFTWFDEGETIRSIIGVIVLTVIACGICLCILVLCIVCLYLGPELLGIIMGCFRIGGGTWGLIKMPFSCLAYVKKRLAKFKNKPEYLNKTEPAESEKVEETELKDLKDPDGEKVDMDQFF